MFLRSTLGWHAIALIYVQPSSNDDQVYVFEYDTKDGYTIPMSCVLDLTHEKRNILVAGYSRELSRSPVLPRVPRAIWAIIEKYL